LIFLRCRYVNRPLAGRSPLIASRGALNAGRSRIASLDMLMNIFFAYYDGPRFQEGMGRTPSEVIAALDDPSSD